MGNISNTVKVGTTTIPLANIDYINEGDGTAYTTPFIMLKSGKRLEARDYEDRSDIRNAVKALEQYEGVSDEQ